MNLLGMFVRRPEPGRTKTRLAATIGDHAAAELYAAFVDDLLTRCVQLTDVFHLAATPNDAATVAWFEPRLTSSTKLLFQPDGDLGERIAWFFESANTSGAENVVLIGSDNPDVPSELITTAFRKLEDVDVVIGPATDGGYVLIGMRKPCADLFAGIRWSSAWTLHDTVEAARSQELSVELLPPWYDIDVVENLGTLMSLQEIATSGAAACPKTVAVLRKLWPKISQAAELP